MRSKNLRTKTQNSLNIHSGRKVWYNNVSCLSIVKGARKFKQACRRCMRLFNNIDQYQKYGKVTQLESTIN